MDNLDPTLKKALDHLKRSRDHTDDWRAKLLLHGGLAILGTLSLSGVGILPILMGAAALPVILRQNRRKLVALAATVVLALNVSLITALALPEGGSSFWTWYPAYVLFTAAIFLPSIVECLDSWSSVKAIWLDVLVAPAALQFSEIIFLTYIAIRLHGILFGIKSFRGVRAGYSKERINGLIIGRYVLAAVLTASLFPLYTDPIAAAVFSIVAYRAVQFSSLIAGHGLTAKLDKLLAGTGKAVFASGRGLAKGGVAFLKIAVTLLGAVLVALFVLLKAILFVVVFAAMLSAGDASGPGFEIGGMEGFDALGGFEGFGEGLGGAEAVGPELGEWDLAGVEETGVEGISGTEYAGGQAAGAPAGEIGGLGLEGSKAEGIDLNGDGALEGYDLNGDGLIDVNELGVEINSLQEVDGYMREDGTFVESYARTVPDGSLLNNLSPPSWMG